MKLLLLFLLSAFTVVNAEQKRNSKTKKPRKNYIYFKDFKMEYITESYSTETSGIRSDIDDESVVEYPWDKLPTFDSNSSYFETNISLDTLLGNLKGMGTEPVLSAFTVVTAEQKRKLKTKKPRKNYIYFKDFRMEYISHSYSTETSGLRYDIDDESDVEYPWDKLPTFDSNSSYFETNISLDTLQENIKGMGT